jgi:Flp pilus assembly protein TadD
MGFSSSRALKRSASTLAIMGALALTGCGSLSSSDDARSATILEAAAPDTKDHVGGAAYWGARYEANREDLTAAMNFARNLRMMGGARQAVAVLKEVVMKAPDDPRVMAEYGKALTAAGRAKEGLPFLVRAVQMKGDDWTTLSAYGVALDQTGSHLAAIEAYQSALAISPNNPVIESNIAMSQVLLGRVDQAEVTLRRLVARPDATPQMRQNLAMIEAMKGNLVEAEQLAREDLPPGEATSNIAVLRQFDARNAKINAEPLPAPSATTPKTSSTSTVPTPAIAAKSASATGTPTPLAPAASTQSAKSGAYKMTPIADDAPASKPAGTPPVTTATKPTTTKQSEAAPATSTTSETKPATTSETKKASEPKKTSGLRQSYDVYRGSTPVSVANATQ